MPTNVAHLEKGMRVKIKREHLKGKEPPTWTNIAIITQFEPDELLTDMNKQGLEIYRCVLQFEQKPATPTSDDKDKFKDRCEKASVLPLMLDLINEE
jgi:hypothetical protein|tara:strand:- start:10 stop:300 length:291 start_codon:yes stop_codon:yes gene_type:complete